MKLSVFLCEFYYVTRCMMTKKWFASFNYMWIVARRSYWNFLIVDRLSEIFYTERFAQFCNLAKRREFREKTGYTRENNLICVATRQAQRWVICGLFTGEQRHTFRPQVNEIDRIIKHQRDRHQNTPESRFVHSKILSYSHSFIHFNFVSFSHFTCFVVVVGCWRVSGEGDEEEMLTMKTAAVSLTREEFLMKSLNSLSFSVRN